MVDHELLNALSEMMDKKLDEKIHPITERLDHVDKRLDGIDKRLDNMDEHFDKLEALITQNYDKAVEFYDHQQVNTELRDRIRVITGELEMHNEQIARNTSDIRFIQMIK